MTFQTLHILIIGASGMFGSRLARLLAQEPGLSLWLAGRQAAPLRALAAELGAQVRLLDRTCITAAHMSDIDVVIDAAGPYKAGETGVIEAALAAGVHYIDLADGRAFVGDIARFDSAARAAGVAIISGASSTPALSHAVIDALTIGWQRIDTLKIAISPRNRQDIGLAVIRSILSYAGKPLRVFDGGAWRDAHGWGSTHKIDFARAGKRYASLCETPDLDLLVARYRPQHSALFFGSLELPIMHLGLTALTRLVRWGLLSSLLPLARPLQLGAMLLRRFGSDTGAMVVEASGMDSNGSAICARWHLTATGDSGPHVPTLAAVALIRQMLAGSLKFRGASPCVGLLKLEDFTPLFAQLNISTNIKTGEYAPPLFAAAIGADFAKLPAVTQKLHKPAPVLHLAGVADVDGAETLLGRLLARLFRFPASGKSVPLRVTIACDSNGTEHWSRIYPARTMRSVMSAPSAADTSVEERFGPLRFRMQLHAHKHGIDFIMKSGQVFGLPMPRWLLPRIAATERADNDRHLFDVSLAAPLLGRLVRYRGWLKVTQA